MTDEDISYNLVKNVAWVHSARTLTGMGHLNESIIAALEPELFEALRNRTRPCSKSATVCDVKFGLPVGTCLFIVRHLIANKLWLVDMNRLIQPALEPLVVSRSCEVMQNGVTG
ncbi:TnsA endonuclease C-terminal domain-containing protein [Paenibacillus sp. MZ04-78.2]|uniref:TnsA endonuclease C-terminal domain-containing protein n=1 Tax=Paenibacillus sp. MZ04-78.2 TaxID=2962034 RepID=UPI0035CA6555